MPDDEATATAEAGYGRVFGRVVVIEDGKERTHSTFFPEFRMRIRSSQTDATQLVDVTGDGSFYWPLKPGEYVIQTLLHGTGKMRLWAVFTAPEPGRAAYIGDMRVFLDRGRFGVTFRDDYAAALKGLQARLAEAKLEPVKALMRPEVVGSYKRMIGICAPIWGIECNRTYQGVEAIRPEGTNESYPTTSSLTPAFEWLPSKAEGVSYDLAIYQADSLVFLDPLNLHIERGKLAHYAEALREPKYQLTVPLQPGRKYMWSVRLRNGDTVSSWTTTSYFAFFIVGSARGSGQWYGFTTPDK